MLKLVENLITNFGHQLHVPNGKFDCYRWWYLHYIQYGSYKELQAAWKSTGYC